MCLKKAIEKYNFEIFAIVVLEDHIIRNEDDLNSHLDYIHYNPIKHEYTQCAKDWEHSSFHKFVKLGFYEENWCDFSRCEDLDIE